MGNNSIKKLGTAPHGGFKIKHENKQQTLLPRVTFTHLDLKNTAQSPFAAVQVCFTNTAHQKERNNAMRLDGLRLASTGYMSKVEGRFRRNRKPVLHPHLTKCLSCMKLSATRRTTVYVQCTKSVYNRHKWCKQ